PAGAGWPARPAATARPGHHTFRAAGPGPRDSRPHQNRRDERPRVPRPAGILPRDQPCRLLIEPLATIDVERLTRDGGGTRRRQEGDGFGHFFRGGDVLQYSGRRDLLVHVVFADAEAGGFHFEKHAQVGTIDVP